MIEVGTRTRQNVLYNNPPQGTQTKTFTRDAGLSKNATGSFTLVGGGTNQIQGANGSFTAFAINDVVLIEGTNLNNGYKTVVRVDTVNGAYLGLAPPPANEGPLTCTIRTA